MPARRHDCPSRDQAQDRQFVTDRIHWCLLSLMPAPLVFPNYEVDLPETRLRTAAVTRYWDLEHASQNQGVSGRSKGARARSSFHALLVPPASEDF